MCVNDALIPLPVINCGVDGVTAVADEEPHDLYLLSQLGHLSPILFCRGGASHGRKRLLDDDNRRRRFDHLAGVYQMGEV
jgi:hypothetical protein